jgi:hypothetical protein
MAYFNDQTIRSKSDLGRIITYLVDPGHRNHDDITVTYLRSFQNISANRFIVTACRQRDLRNSIQELNHQFKCLATWGLIRVPAKSYLTESETDAFHKLATKSLWRGKQVIFNEHIRPDGSTELNYIASKFGGVSGISDAPTKHNLLYIRRVEIAKLVTEMNSERRKNRTPEIPLNPDQKAAQINHSDYQSSDEDIWKLLQLMSPKTFTRLTKSIKTERIELSTSGQIVDAHGLSIRNQLVNLMRLKEDLMHEARQKRKLQIREYNMTNFKERGL